MHTVEQVEKMIYDDPHLLAKIVVCALDCSNCTAFQHILELVQVQDDAARETTVTQLRAAIRDHIRQHAVEAVELQKVRILLTTPVYSRPS
jgi:hypothetical protein